jgi:hypothetical protein
MDNSLDIDKLYKSWERAYGRDKIVLKYKFARSSFLVSECAFKSESLVAFMPDRAKVAWIHRAIVNAPQRVLGPYF